nr:DUF6249 domain-containing protein [Allomuricauda sp.]
MGPELFLITLILSVSATLFFYLKSKHEEAMAKIEHGITDEKAFDLKAVMLNLGIIFLVVGAGLIVAYLISHYQDIPEYVTFPSSILIFGGIGLITCFFVNGRK